MSGSLPAAPPGTPGFPGNPQEVRLDGFETLNTKASRPAIEDNQMFICDGFMPFGKNNLRTLYGPGPVLYAVPDGSGLTIVLHWFGNVGATPYCFVFLSDGSVVQVNTETAAATTIAPAGTILNPSPVNVGISQWGSKNIIVVAKQTNGYFLWDENGLLHTAGNLSPDVTINSGGFGYTSVPTVTAVGGTGSGATFTVTVKDGSVSDIVVTNPGTGYSYYDVVYLAFTGGGGNTTARASATLNPDGSIASLAIDDGGTGYTSTVLVSIQGGGGTGATATATQSGGVVNGITLVKPGESYQSPPTIIITDALNSVAQATVSIMPFGVSGTAVETYQNSVWVANGSKILFTAPGSSSDFGPTYGGGAFESFNSFLKIGFTALRQSNGFLYTLADSSLNAVSGVQTSGTPPITTFSNQNVDPQIGTSWPGSVQVFSRNIVFANSFGVHVSYGGAVTKVSGPLDGIYTTVPNFAGLSPSSAVAVIFGIHVYMLLLPIIDQVTGQQTNKLMMWDGKRWWTSGQEMNLTWIAAQEINSVLTAWGSDGRVIRPLFQTPSDTLVKTVQSKLFDPPGYYFIKMTNRVASLVNYNTVSTAPLLIAVDDGVDDTSSSFTQTFPTLTWTNNSGDPIVWTGLTWGRTGLAVDIFAASQSGYLLGLTVQTQASDMTIISVTAVIQNYQTRI